MEKINLYLIIIIVSVVLLFVAAVLFVLATKLDGDISSRVIDSIESVLMDWETLEQETKKITITTDMTTLYTPESLKKLCMLLGGDEELQISMYYTNHFSTFNKNGDIISTNDYIVIPFIDNEGYNLYYYFMLSGGKVYDIVTGAWK